jgi:hypothetical protein
MNRFHEPAGRRRDLDGGPAYTARRTAAHEHSERYFAREGRATEVVRHPIFIQNNPSTESEVTVNLKYPTIPVSLRGIYLPEYSSSTTSDTLCLPALVVTMTGTGNASLDDDLRDAFICCQWSNLSSTSLDLFGMKGDSDSERLLWNIALTKDHKVLPKQLKFKFRAADGTAPNLDLFMKIELEYEQFV